MNFKRFGGKIFGVQFNKKEQEAIDQEINRQIVEHDRQFDIDKESSILWMLHTQFGFGPKRLRKAWELFFSESEKLRKHYELEHGDEAWIARMKLKDIGVDVEQWYKDYDAENQ